jgi:hypothetical protein
LAVIASFIFFAVEAETPPMTGILKTTVQRESGAVGETIVSVMAGGGGPGVGVSPGASVLGGGVM